MRLIVVERLERVPPQDWNRLTDGSNPFVRHEFLTALERGNCVGGATGWEPQHLLLYRDAAGGPELVGAVPLYRKRHSYGEYVFDWAWADAYERSGHSYYPKLVAAVPFSPVTGPRLLTAATVDRRDVCARLIDGVHELALAQKLSSVHWLFTDAHDSALLEQHGLLRRSGCQFHWSNPGYRDFDDFLATFTAAKRKKIRQERRYVRAAGVATEIVPGREATAAQWDMVYRFYRGTIRAHGAIPYLTSDFFHILGATLASHVVLVFARAGREYMGAALNLRGADTLYGRYWGGRPGINGLHFETCYYTPIEYCIAQRLARFEAGAQGEHKLARGFRPTPTYSAHWLRHAPFRNAVADYLTRERSGMEAYIDELDERAPFKTAAPRADAPES